MQQRKRASPAAERHDDHGPPGGLYERDFLAWTGEQARALRRAGEGFAHGDIGVVQNALAALDFDNLAEELDSLGRSERAELRRRLTTIVEHLLKVQHSPAAGPRAGWRSTVRRGRRDAARLLRDNPSLKPELPGLLGEAAEDAAALLPADMEERGEGEAGELARAMREALREYTPERVLDPDWWPTPFQP